ncbi:porin family protein [Cyclobacterium plantarum]|uniref:PorT family protein n=1 Tax=Cyclobacterium plantarum TaxID=2716263 RepID=A0ABX0H8S1_9BACT|nr:porin family protein [Cyclobacterium plantarum]NHE56778.1 PorT family protein [Cyclobacterium plantarum]
MKKPFSAQIFTVTIMVMLGLFSGINFAFAQSNNPGPKIGIKGGLNLSQLYVDQPNVENESMKMGIHFGLFSKIPINNYVALQPEVLYTNTGSKVSYGGSDFENVFGIETGEIRFNLNYVQVPVALAVNLGPLNVHAGPYLAYLLSANVKDWKSSETSPTQVRELDTKDFNKIDYGLVIGAGFDIKAVNVGARYNYGLRNVGKEGLAGNLTDNSKNAVVQVYLGFGF